jgi:hypothetical protein
MTSPPGYEPDEWWKPLLVVLLLPFFVLIILFDLADCALAEFLRRFGIR